VYGAAGEEALDHGDQWEDRFSAQVINGTTRVNLRGIDIWRGFLCRAQALVGRIEASMLARVRLKSQQEMKHESSWQRLRVQIQRKQERRGDATAASNKSPFKRHYSKLLFAALALIPVALLAQSLAPTPRYSDQAELSKAEEWVLSQGAAESIAPELAAILGVGSDRLPVKLESYRIADGISLAFAVSINPKQEGIVLSALKTIADKMKIYSVGTAWLTDRSGTLRRTIAVDASGARVLPDSSRAAEFKNIKAFFVKKLEATNPSTASSSSPRISATAAGGKDGTK
jgi:hypothetical protein